MGAYEIDGVLSTSNFELNSKIKVYPNPTSGIININIIDFTTAKTTIYDLNGRMLKSQSLEMSISKIDISDLAKGIYLLKIDTETGSITKRIIKK